MRDLYTCESCGFLSTRRDQYVRVFVVGIPQDTPADRPDKPVGIPAGIAEPIPSDRCQDSSEMGFGILVDHPSASSRLLCRSCQAVAEHNMATIGEIPRTLLPDGPARDELVTRARMGEDLYAYYAGTETRGVWNLWIEARADATTERNGRVNVSEWYTDWLTAHSPTPPEAETGQERAATLV